MKKIIIFYLLCLSFLFSCNKDYKRIDGSSKVTFEKSLHSISTKLPILQQEKIKEAIKFIYRFRTTGEEPHRWDQIYQLLNNKSTEQIFDLAEDIAKENNVKWNRVSMNTLDYSVFDETNVVIEREEKLKQINKAVRIELSYQPIDTIADLNEGFYLYPKLVDEDNNEVIFHGLPLQLSISFISNGHLLYLIERTITSSEYGDKRKKQGIKILYSMFDYDKMIDKNINVEVKIKEGNKYLYGRCNDIPVDLRKTKALNSIEKSINEQNAINVIKKFVDLLGEKEYKKAYALTHNPEWSDYEKFLLFNKFGEVEKTGFLTMEVIGYEKDKITTFVLYQFHTNTGEVLVAKQNFIVRKIQKKWCIVHVEDKRTEHKNLIWK